MDDEPGPDGGLLSERLVLKVFETGTGEAIYNGPLADLDADLGTWAPEEERGYDFEVTFPDASGGRRQRLPALGGHGDVRVERGPVALTPRSWSSTYRGRATYAASQNSGSASTSSSHSGAVQPPVAPCSRPTANGPAAAIR